MSDDIKCCVAAVYKADVPRRTGRGPTGFEMHYTKCQCKRAAIFDGRCWQHKDKERFRTEADYYRTVAVKK